MCAGGLRIVPEAAGPAGDDERAVTMPAGVSVPVTVPAGDCGTVTMPAGVAEIMPQAPLAEERRWTARAICADGDPDLLFVTGAAQREAAKLCRNCPVQMECLADALDHRIEFGVWGGLTERQRRALLKRRPDVADWRVLLERARDESHRGVAS